MIEASVADELVAAVRTFVIKEVLPVASEFEHADAYPDDLVAQMKEMGLFGSMVPEEYGGLSLDATTYARVIEEISAGWMSLSGILNTHVMTARLIAGNGTEDQRQRWLPAMATGEKRGCLSLAFDTIYAEGQRRYVESLSAYARQFLERMEKPDVEEISGIAPAVAIRQKNSTRNPRSNVATATEIYDYLRLLFARCGQTLCIKCGAEVRRDHGQPPHRQARLQGPRDRRDVL